MRQERKTKRKQTSYVTLFSLKDKAALFPFVRGVMQYCTTKYHPRPKCGRNIHRYINIKVSPIHTFFRQLIPIFFFLHSHNCMWSMCLKRCQVCACICECVCVVFVELLCECLLSQPHAPSLQKTTCLSNPTADETLEEKRSGEGGG